MVEDEGNGDNEYKLAAFGMILTQIGISRYCDEQLPQRQGGLTGQQSWAQPLGWPLSHQVCWECLKVQTGVSLSSLSMEKYIQAWEVM